MGTFNGWSHDGTNIEQDTDIYAVYINVVLVPSSVKSLANCTWDEIKVMAKDGYLNSSRQWCYNRNGKEEVWFNIGDEKPITMSDGENLTLQIWDFNHDDKDVNGTQKGSFTFGTKQTSVHNSCIGSKTNDKNAWANSYLRLTTLPLVYDKLPSLLKKVITSVYKKSRETIESSTVVSTLDNIWIPSVSEINGKTDGVFGLEGYNYPIFTDNNSRIKFPSNDNGAASTSSAVIQRRSWSTRSIFKNRGGDYRQHRANYEGGIQDWDVSTTTKPSMCFAFCI